MKEGLHRYKGLLFDLNGTMIDDMTYHVEAAANAGINCFVLTTLHSPDEFGEYSNVLGFLQDYSMLL